MKYFIAAAVILFTFPAHAVGWEESAKVVELFKNAGVRWKQTRRTGQGKS